MHNKIIVLSIIFVGLLFSCSKDNATNPQENKVYDNVKIGNQVWMKKNLDVVCYRNGDIIPQINDSLEFATKTTGAWCYYDNNSENGKIYGTIYNWYAVNDPSGLAPKGWHIPTDSEWTVMTDLYGGEYFVGGKLKDTGLTYWKDVNIGATNESGFTGLPGGMSSMFNIFTSIRILGYWWTATEHSATQGKLWSLINGSSVINHFFTDKKFFLSVRCVKD